MSQKRPSLTQQKSFNISVFFSSFWIYFHVSHEKKLVPPHILVKNEIFTS